MGDELKIWTTVGSAGTLSATDLAKVSLDNSVISLGHSIAPPAGTAGDPSIVLPRLTATVRYNVTPVDGLFPTDPFAYMLQVTYQGTVQARLVQVDLYSGAEVDLLHFDSASFPPASSFVMNASAAPDESKVMDFVNFAYYVEATLSTVELLATHPAQIAVVKVYASPTFHG
jgi:hypothetical protein